MKTRFLTHDDIQRAWLFEHADGKVVFVIKLANGLEARLEGVNPTISGFLNWDTDGQEYISGPLAIEDGIGI